MTGKLRLSPERLWLTLFFGALLITAGTAVYQLWAFTTVQQASIDLAFSGIPMPALTTMFLKNTEGFVSFSIPWVLYAIGVVARGRAASRELIAYSSTLAAALLTGTILFGIAMILPWLPRKFTSGNERYWLSQEQRAQAFEAAERGDAEANLRLSEYYAFTTRQSDLAEYYLQRAADLGNAAAQNSLASRARAIRAQKRLQAKPTPPLATPPPER